MTVRILVETRIAAPPERCFDLARSIDLHLVTSASTREIAVGGVTRGLIGLGERVTWRARHFGVWWRATSEIVAFDRPRSFTDGMTRSPFARFHHEHSFEAVEGGTLMRDDVSLASPLGPLGRVADALLVGPHIRRLIADRAEDIRRVAEGDEWRRFLAT